MLPTTNLNSSSITHPRGRESIKYRKASTGEIAGAAARNFRASLAGWCKRNGRERKRNRPWNTAAAPARRRAPRGRGRGEKGEGWGGRYLGGGGVRVVAVARASGTQREGGGGKREAVVGDAMRTQEPDGEKWSREGTEREMLRPARRSGAISGFVRR